MIITVICILNNMIIILFIMPLLTRMIIMILILIIYRATKAKVPSGFALYDTVGADAVRGQRRISRPRRPTPPPPQKCIKRMALTLISGIIQHIKQGVVGVGWVCVVPKDLRRREPAAARHRPPGLRRGRASLEPRVGRAEGPGGERADPGQTGRT